MKKLPDLTVWLEMPMPKGVLNGGLVASQVLSKLGTAGDTHAHGGLNISMVSVASQVLSKLGMAEDTHAQWGPQL